MKRYRRHPLTLIALLGQLWMQPAMASDDVIRLIQCGGSCKDISSIIDRQRTRHVQTSEMRDLAVVQSFYARATGDAARLVQTRVNLERIATAHEEGSFANTLAKLEACRVAVFQRDIAGAQALMDSVGNCETNSYLQFKKEQADAELNCEKGALVRAQAAAQSALKSAENLKLANFELCDCLLNSAQIFINGDNLPYAQQLADQAEKLANSYDATSYQATQSKVIEGELKWVRGENTEAIAIFEQALKMLDACYPKNSHLRSRVLFDLGSAIGETDKAAALKIFEKNISNSEGDKFARADSLVSAAEIILKRDAPAGASKDEDSALGNKYLDQADLLIPNSLSGRTILSRVVRTTYAMNQPKIESTSKELEIKTGVDTQVRLLSAFNSATSDAISQWGRNHSATLHMVIAVQTYKNKLKPVVEKIALALSSGGNDTGVGAAFQKMLEAINAPPTLNELTKLTSELESVRKNNPLEYTSIVHSKLKLGQPAP